MRLLVLLLGLCLFTHLLTAQEIDLDHFKEIEIRNIGPSGMSGRITDIDVDLSDPDIIYAAAASGGVWKSTDGGIAWKPIFDDQPTQAIGALAIDQRNPSVIWVGTGEGNPRNSHNSGGGIYKSLDGGKSWNMMGLEATKTIHRIIIHRDNPDVVYAGAMGSIWGPNEERGVFRTKDGGKTWDKILYVNDQTGVADMIVDPTNPNKMLVAMWEYGRQPWTFNSGGPGSGLYLTYDGGENWKEITHDEGLPKGELGRMGLAIAPSKPNIIYALVEAKENGLYKSVDGGSNWSLVSKENIGNRPFYYAELYVDPQNENRIYNLWSYVSRSEDGGKTFKTLLDYGAGVHPDHHAFWIHPDDPNYLIEGNDGGLYISRDGGDSWRFVENLPVGQFYHIDYDMDNPYNVGGGMQDNGSWVGPSSVWKAGGITNSDWQEVFFGDGFDVVFKPDNNRYVYAMSQGGNVGLVDRKTGYTRFVRPIHPENVRLRFNWNAAIAQDPENPCGVYYGSQFVHYSTDCGESWQILSPDLTTNDPEKQQQEKSGGLTIDNTQAENHTTILAIAPSPHDRNVIWVGTDDGNLQLTRDRGKSWTNLANKLPGVPAGSWIPYIELSVHQPGEAFVVVNDYRRNNWAPMVMHTSNYGESWRSIVSEDQVAGFVLSIVQDPVEPSLLWLGTDVGLYFSIDGGDNWQKYTNGFPSVQVSDLKIHPREHDLVIGTFGRSFWILDDIRPFRALAETNGDLLTTDFKVFDAPDAYLANYRSYQGIRFTADAEYRAPNRQYGAMLTFWVKPEPKAEEEAEAATSTEAAEEDSPEEADPDTAMEEAETKKAGKSKRPKKVKIQVMSGRGDTLRTFSRDVKDGMNRINWGLRRDGVRFPSRRAPRPDDDPPSGRSVLPGVYKLVFTYGDQRDSTLVTVHNDPRIDINTSALMAGEALFDDYYQVVEAATKGFDQLQEARKTIKLIDQALVNAPDSTKQKISKLGKSLQDSIAQLEKLYMDPPGLKGIQRTAQTLNNTLFRVSRYIYHVEGTPNQMVELSLAAAREETREVLEQVNAFFQNDFADYQQQVEAVSFSLFKPFEPVKIE